MVTLGDRRKNGNVEVGGIGNLRKREGTEKRETPITFNATARATDQFDYTCRHQHANTPTRLLSTPTRSHTPRALANTPTTNY